MSERLMMVGGLAERVVAGRTMSDCVSFVKIFVALKRAVSCGGPLPAVAYLELVYFVTAFVPSDTACLASSPGRRSRTAVWISRLVMVERRL